MFARKFFTSVVLAISLAPTLLAAPWPVSSKHVTHRMRELGPNLVLTTFHPESTFEVCRASPKSTG